MIAHRSPISGIATYNGKFVATAGYDNQIILWDSETNIPLSRAWHDHLANQIEFSPDGKYVVTSSSDHTSRLWRLPDLKLAAVLSDHNDDVEMSTFHPVGEPLIATASRDHNVRVFDFNGKLQACFTGHSADVISVAWSTDGREVISSSDDGTIKRWSLAEKRLIDDMDLGGVETDTIAVTEQGRIYAGNDDGEILVIDSDKRVYEAHKAGIKRLIYQGTEHLLVSLSYDRTLIIWSVLEDGALKLLAKSDLPVEVWPRSCAFINRNTLAFATFGTSFAIYHVDQDQWELDRVNHTYGINAVAIVDDVRYTIGDSGVLFANGNPVTEVGSLCNFLTPIGDRLITGGQIGRVADALTNETIYQHRSPLNCGAAFIKNGKSHFVVGAYTGEGVVFSVESDKQVKLVATLALHSNAVKAVAISDNILFSVSADAEAAWFDLNTLEEIGRIEEAHDRIANGCAALPNGEFASVSRDHKLRIWGQKPGEVNVVDTPHDHSIKCVAATQDGRYIATGSYNGVVAIFDRQTNSWAYTFRPTTSGISSLVHDPKHSLFIASSYDGNLYDLAVQE